MSRVSFVVPKDATIVEMTATLPDASLECMIAVANSIISKVKEAISKNPKNWVVCYGIEFDLAPSEAQGFNKKEWLNSMSSVVGMALREARKNRPMYPVLFLDTNGHSGMMISSKKFEVD